MLLQLHGGGWWQGSAFSPVIDTLARERCEALGGAVLTLEYRHAPEHPFPAALDDVTAALAWLEAAAPTVASPTSTWPASQQEGTSLRPPSCAACAPGTSPCAACCSRSRSSTSPPCAPWTSTPPRSLLAGLQECMDLYAPEHGARSDELISPLHAVDLVGHPATTIMTAEHDVLRFDGERYADHLGRAGVPITYLEMAGHLHGSSMLTRSLPRGALVAGDGARAAARALRPPVGDGDASQTGRSLRGALCAASTVSHGPERTEATLNGRADCRGAWRGTEAAARELRLGGAAGVDAGDRNGAFGRIPRAPHARTAAAYLAVCFRRSR